MATQFHLKQLVKFPTRAGGTLDLIRTNLNKFYPAPTKDTPFGLSDHNTVSITPRNRKKSYNAKKAVTVRDMMPSSSQTLGRFVSNINWSDLENVEDINEKYAFFNNVIITIQLEPKTHYPSEFTLSRVKCHKVLIDLPSNLFAGTTTLNYTIITLALVSYLRSSVVRALHRHRKGVGSIPAGGPIVDEFFSTVPGWFFDMCTIQLEPKTHYPSEFTLSRQMPQNLNGYGYYNASKDY